MTAVSDPFFYPPTVCTDLAILGQQQPLLVLAQVTDGGVPVADGTSVEVVSWVDETWACVVIGFYVPPDGSCAAPPKLRGCGSASPVSATSSRTTRNGLVVVTQTVGPSSNLRKVHWVVDGVSTSDVNFPTFDCESGDEPDDCHSPDQQCIFTARGDACSNDRDWIDGVPTLTATPGDGEILWEWTAPDSFDARVPIEYGISVTTGTPSPNPTNTFITDTSLLSTGLTNGATYNARVQAFLGAGVGGIQSDPKSISNVASAVPSGTVEGLTVHLSGSRAHRT